MLCCGKRQQKQQNLKAELTHLEKLTQFNQTELAELRTRFARMSKNSNFLTKPQFRENLGLLGMGTMLYLSDRIFDVMDDDKDGKIRFQDFAKYFDKVCSVDPRDKAEISFKLIDRKKQNYFTFADFNNLMQGMIGSWAAMTGQHITINVKEQLDQRVKEIFQILDPRNENKVTLEQYQQVMINEPNLLDLFDFIKRGMKDIQQIQNYNDEQEQFQEKIVNIDQKVNDLIQFMTTNQQPELPELKCERFSSYKKQKSDSAFMKVPHFTGDQDLVDQNNTIQRDTNNPIDMILHYDTKMNIPKNSDNIQLPSFQLNQIQSSQEIISPHQLVSMDQHDIKDFSFQQFKRISFKQLQPPFKQVPQKELINDFIPQEDDQTIHLSNISEKESEDQQADVIDNGVNVQEYLKSVPEKLLKDKFVDTVNMLKDLKEELQQLKQQMNLEKYQKQKRETQNQFMDQNIAQLKASTNVHKIRQQERLLKNQKKPKISVSFGHENFNLVINMMIGIQMAVNSINMADDYDIGDKDFKLKYYFELLPRRVQGDKSSFKVCQFFDYAPRVFNSIRTIYGIDNQSYLKSIGPESLLSSLLKGDLTTLQELTSTGKSGSFFYYTADSRFTLKTIHHQEFRCLKQLIKSYYQYLKSNTDSFIIKLFGMHKIGIKYGSLQKERVIYFVIMGNVFTTNKEIHVRYDLKGSTHKRETTEIDPTVAKKDLNFIIDKEYLKVEPNKRFSFMQQLEKDCKWFAQNHIIDYSLLVGIHKKQNKQLEFNESSIYSDNPYNESLQVIQSIDGEKTFFFGIIDILTSFSTKKKLEYFSKRILIGPTISAIPPQDYAQRFYDFIDKYLFCD